MTRMKSLGVALTSIVLGGGILAVAGYALASAAPHQPAVVATPINGNPHHVAITIAEYPDSSFSTIHGANGGAHADWVSYSSDNLVVPANSLVTMTVKGYDGGGVLNNTYFGNVIGTVGGTYKVEGASTNGILRSWDPTQVAHTFTIRGVPGTNDPLFVSVPIPVNPTDCSTTNDACATQGGGYYPKVPVTVTFTFRTHGKGVYEWNCEYPCGSTRQGQFGGAMSTYSYMSGTLTVK